MGQSFFGLDIDIKLLASQSEREVADGAGPLAPANGRLGEATEWCISFVVCEGQTLMSMYVVEVMPIVTGEWM